MRRLALLLLLVVGCAKAPVIPDPPQPEPPVVDVTPVPAGSLRVIIWRETDSIRVPEGQLRQFYGPELNEWLRANAQFRIWDIDVTVAPNEKPEFRKLAEKRPDKEKLPWIVVDDGRDRFEGALPATPAETIALLERYKR